jgi:hypothetical protein
MTTLAVTATHALAEPLAYKAVGTIRPQESAPVVSPVRATLSLAMC